MNRKPQPTTPTSSQAGFTVIESLVAIIVVSILLVALAPVIVLSTATRVQARRVERATQAARTFIDAARTGTVDAPKTRIDIPPASGTVNRNVQANAQEYLISNLSQMPLPTSTDDLYCVAINGRIYNPTNSTTPNIPKCSAIVAPDKVAFYIQAARIGTATDSSNYRLALRVYRDDINFSRPLTANLDTTVTGTGPNQTLATQRSFTGGTGLRNPQSALVEMTTDVNSKTASFYTLCQRLGVRDSLGCQQK